MKIKCRVTKHILKFFGCFVAALLALPFFRIDAEAYTSTFSNNYNIGSSWTSVYVPLKDIFTIYSGATSSGTSSGTISGTNNISLDIDSKSSTTSNRQYITGSLIGNSSGTNYTLTNVQITDGPIYSTSSRTHISDYNYIAVNDNVTVINTESSSFSSASVSIYDLPFQCTFHVDNSSDNIDYNTYMYYTAYVSFTTYYEPLYLYAESENVSIARASDYSVENHNCHYILTCTGNYLASKSAVLDYIPFPVVHCGFIIASSSGSYPNFFKVSPFYGGVNQGVYLTDNVIPNIYSTEQQILTTLTNMYAANYTAPQNYTDSKTGLNSGISTVSTFEDSANTTFQNAYTNAGINSMDYSSVASGFALVSFVSNEIYTNLPPELQLLLMSILVCGFIFVFLSVAARIGGKMK